MSAVSVTKDLPGTAEGGAAATVKVIGVGGKALRAVELPADIFDVQANIPLMHQVVVAQLAAARQGTHKAKNRGEVSGGGRKPYKQKGTGRARQGSIRAPQFTGGGVVHGPVPRDYAQRTPKKMKVAALRGALSDRARSGRIHVVDTFIDDETPRTKTALATLEAVVPTATSRQRVLVVLHRDDEVNWMSLRNLPSVHLIEADQLNTYDVLASDEVVFTAEALEDFLGAPTTVVPLPPAEGDEGDDGDEAADATAKAGAKKAKTGTAKAKTGGTKAKADPEAKADDGAADDATAAAAGADEEAQQ